MHEAIDLKAKDETKPTVNKSVLKPSFVETSSDLVPEQTKSRSNRKAVAVRGGNGGSGEDEATTTTGVELMETDESDRQPTQEDKDGTDSSDVEMEDAPSAAVEGSTKHTAATAESPKTTNNNKKVETKAKGSEATIPTDKKKSTNGDANGGGKSGKPQGKNGDDEKQKKRSSTGSTKNGATSSTTNNAKQQAVQQPQVDSSKTNGSTSAAPAAAASPPPPVMKGTLSYNLETRRHLIRGMWNYENSTVSPSQRFELLRTLGPDEDPTVLPKDGEFHGSFSLIYVHTTSKGKQKERSKVIPESGVKIKFIKVDDKEGEYKVDGFGTNQFGLFHIYGTATPSGHEGDPTMNVVLRKKYEPAAPPAGDAAAAAAAPVAVTAAAVAPAPSESKKQKTSDNKSVASVDANAEDSGPLPDPAQSFPTGVVCLRGPLCKIQSNDLGLTEVVHRVTGFWAGGLDSILGDPQNTSGLLCRFEYEHKSSVPSTTVFPVSGRYSGWFDLANEDGSRTHINERDVVLKFRKNNAGYHNVEGKGSNVFGKYTITGTLTLDNVLTIFRHFLPRKLKTSKAPVTSAPPPINAPQARRASTPAVPSQPEPKLKMDDVKIEGEAEAGDGPLEPIKPPANSTYSAVSRGVLRVNDDGSHSCNGKWAITREHFTNGQTSGFNFRLEPHFAEEALGATRNGKDEAREFPLDSPMYKGSFQLKKQGSRYQTVVDQQVVMKFRLNTQGSYNVYGKGVNPIGEFNLLGTMVMSGKTGGQVELYRMYLPGLAAPAAAAAVLPVTAASAPIEVKNVEALSPTAAAASLSVLPKPLVPLAPSSGTTSILPGPPLTGIQRRESTRLVKLPSRLEDGDPSAQLSRTMEKCAQILKFIRDKDKEFGSFFSEPVDPVALGIPTYHQVIKEPMDLKTINRKLDLNEIDSPEEFSRLVRLTFENAMTFNIDPTHNVHQAARQLLIIFNQKYRDVERMVQNIRRTHGDFDDKGKKKGKDDKKRKRGAEETKSLKRRRLDEAQAMAMENSKAVANILAAAPAGGTASVSRAEFTMLLELIQQLQRQIVETHTALAELSPGDDNDATSVSTMPEPKVSTAAPTSKATSVAAPEKKKAPKRKSITQSVETTKVEEPPAPAPAPVPAPAPAPAVSVDDSAPLSLDEQELLTETINQLPPEHLGGVIQIIREAAPVGADEDEIDLEIDQLDTKTQRKLLKHVSKFVKKSKTKPKKKPKTGSVQHPPKKPEKQPPSSKDSSAEKPSNPKSNAKKGSAKPESKAKAPAPAADSFFAFGGKDDSDSDSDDDDDSEPYKPMKNNKAGGKVFSSEASSEFKLGVGLGDLHHDDEDDLGTAGIASAWNITNAIAESSKKVGDEDDAWGAAREEAALAKAREHEKKAREEKLKAEAEQMTKQRIAEANARSEELRAQRAEEEANEARLKEEREKKEEEARKAAREAARKKVQSVEQTVDLDLQRDIMKQYEQSYMDKDLGGASPTSDFGF